MVERPILFSAAMVRAILADQKTQTRRLMKPQPDCFGLEHSATITPHPSGSGEWLLQRWPKQERQMHNFGRCEVVKPCPYGATGDRLWVRESGWEPSIPSTRQLRDGADTWPKYSYDADGHTENDIDDFKRWDWKRRPSIHMPRWASRITLEITGVRVERLQDISEKDCWAEGIEQVMHDFDDVEMCHWANRLGCCIEDARPLFAQLWSTIHAVDGPNGWTANPWVWVVQFERVEKEAVQPQ